MSAGMSSARVAGGTPATGSTKVFVPKTGAAPASVPENCALCNEKVIKKQSVYESETYRILADHRPLTRGHLLIVPKMHTGKVHELKPHEAPPLDQIFPKIAKVFQEKFGTDQYIVLQKNGPNAGQTVPHVHYHVFPVPTSRWKNIVQAKILFRIAIPCCSRPMKKNELVRTVSGLKSAFEAVDLKAAGKKAI